MNKSAETFVWLALFVIGLLFVFGWLIEIASHRAAKVALTTILVVLVSALSVRSINLYRSDSANARKTAREKQLWDENYAFARDAQREREEVPLDGIDEEAVDYCLNEAIKNMTWSTIDAQSKQDRKEEVRNVVVSRWRYCVDNPPKRVQPLAPGYIEDDSEPSEYVPSEDSTGTPDYDSPDPCDGYNICNIGPEGEYGEDWINDPWDEPYDGR